MPTIIISGANRGLGLEFAKQYAEEGARVFAGARDPGAATALNEAAKTSAGKLTVQALDVADGASVNAFARFCGAKSPPLSPRLRRSTKSWAIWGASCRRRRKNETSTEGSGETN